LSIVACTLGIATRIKGHGGEHRHYDYRRRKKGEAQQGSFVERRRACGSNATCRICGLCKLDRFVARRADKLFAGVERRLDLQAGATRWASSLDHIFSHQ
jgi:hypothetical protein